MNTATLLGMLTGVIIALLIWLITIKATKKYRFGNKPSYDERQRIEQGKAYRIGFFAIMLYNVIYGITGALLDGTMPIDPVLSSFISIFIGAFAFATYAIFHDSYISINEASARTKIILAVIGALNLVSGAINIYNHELFVDGVLTFRTVNLFCGVLLIALLVEILIKEKMNRKESMDEKS